jgi:hypothetical protein
MSSDDQSGIDQSTPLPLFLQFLIRKNMLNESSTIEDYEHPAIDHTANLHKNSKVSAI